jgi:hypothetical protein
LRSIQDVQPKKLLQATVPLSTLYENVHIKDKLEWAPKRAAKVKKKLHSVNSLRLPTENTVQYE